MTRPISVRSKAAPDPTNALRPFTRELLTKFNKDFDRGIIRIRYGQAFVNFFGYPSTELREPDLFYETDNWSSRRRVMLALKSAEESHEL